MTEWAPIPTTSGLSTFFTDQGEALLPAAVTFESTVAETGGDAIDTISPFLVAASDEPATVLLEVFAAGDEVPAADVRTSIFRPTDDHQIGGVDSEASSWATSSLTTTNLYQRIDEATLNTADWITYFDGMAAAKRYRFNVGTGGASWPANRQVVGGRVRVHANREEINGTLRAYYWDGTVAHFLGSVVVGQKRRTLSIPFPEFNPATNLPWTRGEIQALGSTTSIQLRPRNVNKQKQLFIYQAWLELDWVPEVRVAVGVAEVDASTTGDSGAPVPFSLRNPNTAVAQWGKAGAGSSYTIVLRRIDGDGRVGWRWLAESEAAASALGREAAGEMLPVASYVPVLDARGFVSVMGDVVAGRAHTFYMTRVDADVSVDGQPYAEDFVESFAGGGVGQTLSPPAGTYSLVRFMVSAYNLAAGRMATEDEIAVLDDLSVKVKVESSDVQVGTTAVISPNDVLDAPSIVMSAYPSDGVRIPQAFLVDADVGAAVVTAVDHYVEVSTGGAPTDDVQWVIRGVRPSADIAVAIEPTFGGGDDSFVATDGSTILGVSDNVDLTLTLSTAPDPPADLTATIATVDGNPNTGCTIPTAETVALTWTPTSLDADFERYEIERKTGDGEWVHVLYGDTENVGETVDRDPSLTLPESYRIRVVRAGDLIPSAWSTATTPVQAEPVGAEVIFSSNWLRATHPYNRANTYDYPYPDNDTVLQLAGRDGQVVFVEAEDRLVGGADGIDLPIILLVAEPWARPDQDGEAVADVLRRWLRLPAPHITVRDAMGNRWYGRARLHPATQVEDRGQGVFEATVNLVVTQTDPTPAPIG